MDLMCVCLRVYVPKNVLKAHGSLVLDLGPDVAQDSLEPWVLQP